MKTAFKLSEYSEGMKENTIGFFDSLEEAQNQLPPGYTHYGTLKLDDPKPYFQITKFTYPDLIADMQSAWDNKEIIQVLYFYK